MVELTDPADHTKQLFGWVTALNARYVSLTTRDGTEWLVPNEDLISRRVINWSYSHNRLRLLTPIGVSFDCDVRLAMQLAEEAARETPRVLRDPAPVCRLMGFGDSAVNLEMRFWIDDPANGVINVRSQVLLSLWEKFRANGIRTPLGHRDLLHQAELRPDRSPRRRRRPRSSHDRSTFQRWLRLRRAASLPARRGRRWRYSARLLGFRRSMPSRRMRMPWISRVSLRSCSPSRRSGTYPEMKRPAH